MSQQTKTRGRPRKNPNQTSSPTTFEPSNANPGEPFSDTYTPPLEQSPVASTQEPTDITAIPTPPQSATGEKRSSGSSKASLKKLAAAPATQTPATSPRPYPARVLGRKDKDNFLWSAQHDDDAEFSRRYVENAEIREFMLKWHAEDPETEAARARILSLTPKA